MSTRTESPVPPEARRRGQEQRPSSDEANEHSPTPKRVALVDDDEVYLRILATRLRRAGYEVHTFGSAADALACLRARVERFSIVVTDYRMREIDGIQLAREIARLFPDVPVAICSASVTPELRERAAAVTASAVFGKPLALVQLQELLADRRGSAGR